MENTPTIYKASGKAPLLGIILPLILGGAAAVGLNYGYVWLVQLVPFVILNVLSYAAFVILLVFITSIGIHLGKLRNVQVAVLIGLVLGVFAVYVNWALDVHTLTGAKALRFAPGAVFSGLASLYENGWFSMGRGAGGTNVSGIMLGFIWVGEAVGILGGCALSAGLKVKTGLFCEECKVWAYGSMESGVMEGLDDNEKSAVLAGNIAPLLGKSHVPDAKDPLSQDEKLYRSSFELEFCEKCESFAAVTISETVISLDENGKRESEENTLISNLLLNKSDFEKLRKIVPPPGSNDEN